MYLAPAVCKPGQNVVKQEFSKKNNETDGCFTSLGGEKEMDLTQHDPTCHEGREVWVFWMIEFLNIFSQKNALSKWINLHKPPFSWKIMLNMRSDLSAAPRAGNDPRCDFCFFSGAQPMSVLVLWMCWRAKCREPEAKKWRISWLQSNRMRVTKRWIY